jgi:hypothetical protein
VTDEQFSFGAMCEECVNYIIKVQPTLERISNDLRTAPSRDLLGELVGFEEGLSWLVSFGSKSDIFLPDEELKSEFAFFVSQIDQGSRDFVVALENGDYLDLADVIDYEFLPALIRMRDTVAPLVPH